METKDSITNRSAAGRTPFFPSADGWAAGPRTANSILKDFLSFDDHVP
jgi:hypothetical protein